MIAVIKTGGKQYKVKEGEVIKIEKIAKEPGEILEFEVLMVGDEEGKDVKIGTPFLSDVKVTGKVLEHGKDKKVLVTKYKPKVRYTRNVGHRQFYTKVEIQKI